MGTRGISPVPGACQSRYVKLEIQALCQSCHGLIG
jgi:hypothetical protein